MSELYNEGKPLPTLIVALLDRLPLEGKSWPEDQREAWTDVLLASFDLLYGKNTAEPQNYQSRSVHPATISTTTQEYRDGLT